MSNRNIPNGAPAASNSAAALDTAAVEFVQALALQLSEWRNLRKAGVGVRLLTLRAKSGRSFLCAAFALRGHDLSADDGKINLDGESIEEILPRLMEEK